MADEQDLHRHFADLGLGDDALRVYLDLLRCKETADDATADDGDQDRDGDAGEDGGDGGAAACASAPDARVVASLVEAGLVMPSGDDGAVHAVEPRVALNRLIDDLDADLRSRQARVAHMRRVTSDLAADVERRRRLESASLEVVEGRGAISDRVNQLLQDAREETLVMLAWTPPLEALPATRVHDAALLERDVTVRMLALLAHHRASPEYASHLQALADLGAEVRLAAVLPTRLIIVDRSVAIVPTDPNAPEGAATIVHQQAVVALMVNAFESAWRAAEPLCRPTRSQEWEPDTLTVKVLTLLAEGHKDEAVSRRVGMSVRSLRRLISRVCEEVGAESRLQLGVVASRNGWIAGSDDA